MAATAISKVSRLARRKVVARSVCTPAHFTPRFMTRLDSEVAYAALGQAVPPFWLGLLLVLLAVVLICGAGLAALVWFNHRAGRKIESQMFVPRKAHLTPEIELLRQYIRIDTSNPPGNEVAGARFLADLLEKGGVQ